MKKITDKLLKKKLKTALKQTAKNSAAKEPTMTSDQPRTYRTVISYSASFTSHFRSIGFIAGHRKQNNRRMYKFAWNSKPFIATMCNFRGRKNRETVYVNHDRSHERSGFVHFTMHRQPGKCDLFTFALVFDNENDPNARRVKVNFTCIGSIDNVCDMAWMLTYQTNFALSEECQDIINELAGATIALILSTGDRYMLTQGQHLNSCGKDGEKSIANSMRKMFDESNLPAPFVSLSVQDLIFDQDAVWREEWAELERLRKLDSHI